MRSHRRLFGFVFAGLVATGLATVPVVAQMHGGAGQSGSGQMHGQSHQAGMQGMTSATQMMRDVNTTMTRSTAMMSDFAATHQGMPGHDQMVSSMQGMLDQMRQFQGSMNDVMNDQTLMQNGDAMKAFHQMGQSFQQMGAAFQSLLKNANAVMKSMPHEPKK